MSLQLIKSAAPGYQFSGIFQFSVDSLLPMNCITTRQGNEVPSGDKLEFVVHMSGHSTGHYFCFCSSMNEERIQSTQHIRCPFSISGRRYCTCRSLTYISTFLSLI